MQCCFCGKYVEDIEEAVELDWYPDFWHGEIQYEGPICPECQCEHLETDEDGEYVLKADHPLPPSAVPEVPVETPQSPTPLEANSGIRQKFALGQIVATPAALEAISEAGQSPEFFLDKHVQGDWGEVCDEDKAANNQAVADGERILSAYRTLLNIRIWIITEAMDDQGQRAATTILLPDEY